MRVLGALVLPIALFAAHAPASAVEALPDSGKARIAAYQVCHSLAAVDMGSAGSQSATECNGIVKNLDAQKLPDNLMIHCVEATVARPGDYRYNGSCVQTDADGDKIFVSYDGSGKGEFKWIGGTGKYKDIEGAGSLGVEVAPGGTTGLFAYTLTFDASWTHKAK